MRKKEKRRSDKIVIANKTDNFKLKESYKELRTNVSFLLPDKKCKVIVVTSSEPMDGKTTTVVNLAIGLGETGNRVLVIDADMRKPRIHLIVNKAIESGLSEFLIGRNVLEESVKTSDYNGVDVITAGALPPNPAELLGAERFHNILKQASESYDYIIIDTPPVNVVSDCLNIANVVDGFLFVVRSESSQYPSIDSAMDKMKLVNANVLGFILTSASETKKGHDRYHYWDEAYYSYGQGRGK